jgi:hypothetical protein
LLSVVLGSSLAVFGAWGIVVFVLVVGLAVYVHEAESLSSLTFLALVVLCLMCLIGLLMPAVESAVEPARRVTCANNLKQIVLALLEYERANGHFPPAYIADKNGKPIHSWRVLILPNLDYDSFYKMYDFTERWDSPKNQNVSVSRLPTYVCPCDPGADPQTNYVAVVGPDSAWTGAKPRKLADFGKDASHTIMLVESARSGVLWAEPRDFSLDSLSAAMAGSPAISSNHGLHEHFFFTYGPGVNVALADGSVCYLSLGNRPPDDLRKLLQIGGFREEEAGAPERHPNWSNIAALAVWLLSVGTLLVTAVRSRKKRSTTSG